MDRSVMNFNINFYDRINRLVIGTMALLATMATNGIPPWVALLTLYPILTAIVAWDPLYAAVRALFSKLHKNTADTLRLKGGKLALE